MSEVPIVVISGQVSAGKTMAGKILEGQGFQYARISQAIKKLRWDPQDGESPSRSWYQETGMDLHRTIGQSALCEETMTFIPNSASAFVIDGARWKEDVAFFDKRFEKRLIHIHLTAPVHVRERRFQAREKDVSFAEADGHEVEQEIPRLAEGAHVVFDNDTDDRSNLEAFLNSVLERRTHAR